MLKGFIDVSRLNIGFIYETESELVKNDLLSTGWELLASTANSFCLGLPREEIKRRNA